MPVNSIAHRGATPAKGWRCSEVTFAVRYLRKLNIALRERDEYLRLEGVFGRLICGQYLIAVNIMAEHRTWLGC
jgi:hypothetical protein